MDFRFSAEESAFRDEVREFILAEIPPEIRWQDRVVYKDDLWPAVLEARRKVAQRGWTTMHWPSEHGGQDCSPVLHMLFREEMAYWGVPEAISFDDGPNLIGPAIIEHGSEQLKSSHLPSIANADTFWCQGYTEPGGGSDLASVRTTAVQDGDRFIVSGQKDYVGGAARADWIHILARTNPDAPRHRDVSYFVINMNSPKITLRALDEVDGRSGMLNEVFFNDLEAPEECMVGERGMGWYVAVSVLNRQRVGIEMVGRARALLDDLAAYTRETASGDKALFDLPHVRSKLGEMAMSIEACRVAAYRVAWLQKEGLDSSHEASMSRLLSSEMWRQFTGDATQVLGLYGSLEPGSRAAPLMGRLEEAFISSVAATLHLGTSEMQRTIIAQRGLGMPRE